MDSEFIPYLFIIILVFMSKINSTDIKVHGKSEILSRNARTTGYVPSQSGIGLTAAMSVPLDNGRGNIFLSWCIGTGPGESEYDAHGGPNPSPFKTIYEDTLDKKSRKLRERNGFLTRKKFYRIFTDKLKQSGFHPVQCILKAICETAQHQFGKNNGVLGDIIHILFTPTASKDEKLPTRYYEAETNGHLNLCDKTYSEKCPVSVLDLITAIL